MCKPHYLYKYVSFSDQSLRNLKERVIYFGSPFGFNDPYDCAVSPLIESPTDTEVIELRDTMVNSSNMDNDHIEKLKQDDLDVVRDFLLRAAEVALENEIKKFLSQRGVSCFSERNDDLLMWAQYAGIYKGFCLEFSARAHVLSKARKVLYPPTPPSVSVHSLLLDRELSIVDTLFCTKSKDWAHEREWRVGHAKAGSKVIYNPDDLTGVYFGSEIDQPSLEIVRLIVESEHKNVRFWKGYRSTTEFRVLFHELT